MGGKIDTAFILSPAALATIFTLVKADCSFLLRREDDVEEVGEVCEDEVEAEVVNVGVVAVEEDESKKKSLEKGKTVSALQNKAYCKTRVKISRKQEYIVFKLFDTASLLSKISSLKNRFHETMLE